MNFRLSKFANTILPNQVRLMQIRQPYKFVNNELVELRTMNYELIKQP